ncbi:uncharacterized protein Fot_22076 [Forsythia ovata]|uniref:DUF1985 domain-containing protein n=1 Tax=Forsythia ovata TaxID=205694 RepID=A0ABD1UYB8_9LAMI
MLINRLYMSLIVELNRVDQSIVHYFGSRTRSCRSIDCTIEYFVDKNFVTESKVSSRSTIPKIDAVNDALDDEHKELFLNLCYGNLYNVRSMQISLKLIHNLLIRRVRSENADELWFCLENEQVALFSFFEFTLVTNFKLGDEVEYKNRMVQSGRLFETYFGDGDKITLSRLYKAFDNEEDDMDNKYKLGMHL